MIDRIVLFLQKEINSIVGKIVWVSKDERSFLIRMFINGVPDHCQLFGVAELMNDHVLIFENSDDLDGWVSWHKSQKNKSNVVHLHSRNEKK
jgi:hypothetical protein